MSPPVRRWLSRLSFSFFVIAFFLSYEAHRRYVATGGALVDWRTLLAAAGAIVSLGLGFIGVRERHRDPP